MIDDRDAGSIAMGASRTKDDRGNRLGAIGMLTRFTFLVVLLLQATSCVRPELIENAALNQGRMYEVIERASAASRLGVIHPLTVQLISRVEVSKLLQEDASTTTQPDAWAASQAGRSAMGLASESNGTLSTQVALLSRTTAGLYMPSKKTLYIIDERARSASGGIHLDSLGSLGKEVTLAHEVIHALQHQHYPNLFEPHEALWPQQTDATLALQAAKEGDATLWAAQSFGLLGKARDPEDVIEASREAVVPSPVGRPLIPDRAQSRHYS